MKTYRVSFKDTFENFKSEEQVHDALIQYLSDCVWYSDVSGFDFELIHCTPPNFEPAQEEV